MNSSTVLQPMSYLENIGSVIRSAWITPGTSPKLPEIRGLSIDTVLDANSKSSNIRADSLKCGQECQVGDEKPFRVLPLAENKSFQNRMNRLRQAKAPSHFQRLARQAENPRQSGSICELGNAENERQGEAELIAQAFRRQNSNTPFQNSLQKIYSFDNL